MLLSAICRHVYHHHKQVATATLKTVTRWRCAVDDVSAMQGLITFQPVRFAGHSHWQNVRHTKEAKDMQKQKIAASITRRIRNAVRDGGSANPKVNSALARVLEEGKANDVSNTTMMETLRKLEKAKDIKGSIVYVEAKGVGNCMVVVETYTDRPKWTRQLVQHVMKKYGGSIGESGTSMHSFQLKGIVYVPSGEGCELTKDQAFEAALESGAEEVVEGVDDDDKPAFQFICEPKQLHTVKKALEEKGLQSKSARLEYVPHMFTQLDSDSLDRAALMLDELETLEDVVRVYNNIESSPAK